MSRAGEVYVSAGMTSASSSLSLHFRSRPRLLRYLALPAYDSGAEHTKAVICRTKDRKYVARLYESDALYDLRGDPSELDNRIEDPSLAKALEKLREQVLTFYLETSDVVPHDSDQRS